MNATIETYNAQNPLKALIGTKKMYKWLDKMLAVRANCLPDIRAYQSMTRAVATLMRSIRDTEIFNYRVKTKWAMLRDPAWRARVRRELGGEKALRRWEARKVKAEATEWSPREPVKSTVSEKADLPQTRRFVTDSQGQFRLAPITAERPWYITSKPRERSDERSGLREIRLPDLDNIKYPVIPLEAFELRRESTPSPCMPAPERADGVDLLRQATISREPKGRTKHLALNTGSDYVIDTATPTPHAKLNVRWSGMGLGPD